MNMPVLTVVREKISLFHLSLAIKNKIFAIGEPKYYIKALAQHSFFISKNIEGVSDI